MKSVILHIGPHKTGSTYLQKTLRHLSASMALSGASYPESLIGPEYGHHSVPALLQAGRYDELERRLSEAWNEDSTLILSSENLDRLAAPEIIELRRLLGTVNARIVYFVRNPADILASQWQEDVKHGSLQSYHEFALQHLVYPFRSKLLNHRIVLDRYTQAFGSESLRIVDYDAAIAEGDLFDAFCRASGLQQFVGQGSREQVNKSFEPWEVELIRSLNAIGAKRKQLNGANVRTAYLQVRATSGTKSIALRVKRIAMQYEQAVQMDGSYILDLIHKECRKAYPDFPARRALRPTRAISDRWMMEEEALDAAHEIYLALEGALREQGAHALTRDNARPERGRRTAYDERRTPATEDIAADESPFELRQEFRSFQEWTAWANQHSIAFSVEGSECIVAHVRSHGVCDPLTLEVHPPDTVEIAGINLRESIRAGRLISRQRALLLALRHLADGGRKDLVATECRIYVPEGPTAFAHYMHDVFPRFVGTEIAANERTHRIPDPTAPKARGVPRFPDGVFDLALSNDLFQHEPDLDQALRETARILGERGVLIATFPFAANNPQSIVKTKVNPSRAADSVTADSPAPPGNRATAPTIYEIPAWDLIGRARAAGFADACFNLIGSARHGVAGQGINGVFVFLAQRRRVARVRASALAQGRNGQSD